RGPNACPTFSGPAAFGLSIPVASTVAATSMVAPGAATVPRPVIAPKIAPGGNPVVSNGTTPVAIVFCTSAAPQAGHRPTETDVDSPQWGQNMGKLLVYRQLWPRAV